MAKTQVRPGAVKLFSTDPVVVLTTVDERGRNNTAAIGSYCRISSTIILAVYPGHHTYENIMTKKEFVVNLPGKNNLESIMVVSRSYRGKENEIEASGLTPLALEGVTTPGIEEFAASVHCTYLWEKPEGSHSLIAGRMREALVDEDLLDDSGMFDQVKAGVLHIARYPDPVYTCADRYLEGSERM
ncbi:flavin reductase family protein [Fibrobacterota bacterium]